MIKISKEELEDYLGYEIRKYEVHPIFKNGECRGLNINVEPRQFIKSIKTSVKILRTGELFPLNII